MSSGCGAPAIGRTDRWREKRNFANSSNDRQWFDPAIFSSHSRFSSLLCSSFTDCLFRDHVTYRSTNIWSKKLCKISKAIISTKLCWTKFKTKFAERIVSQTSFVLFVKIFEILASDKFYGQFKTTPHYLKVLSEIEFNDSLHEQSGEQEAVGDERKEKHFSSFSRIRRHVVVE